MINEEKQFRILFVDDDKATNFLNKHIAKKNNTVSSIALVDSGFEAVSYIEKCSMNPVERPDLIFLDINMPAMNGWEFLEAFYEIEETLIDGIKVVILSSSNDINDLNRYNNYEELLDFVRKPLDIDSFNSVLIKLKESA